MSFKDNNEYGVTTADIFECPADAFHHLPVESVVDLGTVESYVGDRAFASVRVSTMANRRHRSLAQLRFMY